MQLGDMELQLLQSHMLLASAVREGKAPAPAPVPAPARRKRRAAAATLQAAAGPGKAAVAAAVVGIESNKEGRWAVSTSKSS